MPFTPFHMGPALLVKPALGRRFSVLAFGLAQVAMDIEPGLGLLLGWERLHGWTHTYAGAVVIGTAVALTASPACRWILRRWHAELRHHRLDWLAGPDDVARGAVAAGAYAGTLSHVAFDSLMHADMHPFAPWSTVNGWLDAIPVGTLELACVAAGALGISAWIAAAWRRRARPGA